MATQALPVIFEQDGSGDVTMRKRAVRSGDTFRVPVASEINGDLTILGGNSIKPAASQDLTFEAVASQNVVVKMSDDAGAQKVSFTDSGDSEVASINSDGDLAAQDITCNNLTVNGTQTIVEGTTVTFEDSVFLMAKDATGSPTLDIGFVGERGDSDNIFFGWDESADEFVLVTTDDTGADGAINILDYADLRLGGLAVDDNATIGGTLGVTGATTLAGATVDSLVINGSTAITSIDTDLSTVSGSDDTLASAKAIKAYVDAQGSGSLSGLSDTTITGPASADVLRYNGSAWVDASLSEAGIQAQGDVLDDLNTLGANAADGEFLVGTGAGALAWESGATARTSLGVAIGSDVQAFGEILDDLNTLGAASAANKMIYSDGVGSFAYADISAAGRAILDDADASAQRTTLGLAIGTDVQAYDAGLADIAALAVTDGNIIVGDGANWVAESGATARASLGLTIGTDVQAFSQVLTDIAALSGINQVIGFDGSGDEATFSLSAFAQTLIDDADASTARGTLGLGNTDSVTFDGVTAGSVTNNGNLNQSATSEYLQAGWTAATTNGATANTLATIVDESGLKARLLDPNSSSTSFFAGVWRSGGYICPIGYCSAILIEDNVTITMGDILVASANTPGRVTIAGETGAPAGGDDMVVIGRALADVAGGSDQTVAAWLQPMAPEGV